MGNIVLLVIIGLAVIIVLYFIGVQRNLVKLDEMMKNSLGQINAQLKTRWDAVTALVQMTKQYAEYEHNTMMDVIKERRMSSVSSAEDVNSQNSAIESVMGKIIAVAEQYPDLKASQTFINTMDGIKGYEENVRLSRMVYNDSVTKLNTLIRQFPSSIVANMLHFTTQNYIEEDKAKSEVPNIEDIFKGGTAKPQN